MQKTEPQKIFYEPHPYYGGCGDSIDHLWNYPEENDEIDKAGDEKVKNFAPVSFDADVVYIKLFTFSVKFVRPLAKREFARIIADRIFVSLHQIGVQLHSIQVFNFDVTVTVVAPSNVTETSVVETITKKIHSISEIL